MSSTDREKSRFRGPVRMCVEEVSYHGGKHVITTEFSSDGKLLSTRHLYSDGSEWITTQTYDVDGRLIKTSIGKLGHAIEETIHDYDEAGRLVLITNSARRGDRVEFQYDREGLKTSIQYFDPLTLARFQDGNVAVEGSFWDAATSGIGVPIGGTITTTYNLNDQPREAEIRDADGQILKHFVRTYDADGCVLEERAVSKNVARNLTDRLVKNIPPEARDRMASEEIVRINQTLMAIMGNEQVSIVSYTYDAKGRATRMRRSHMSLEIVTSTTYDDHGEKVEERQDFITNSAFVSGVRARLERAGLAQNAESEALQSSHQLHQIPTARFDYQYDSYGNWTQQTVGNATDPNVPSTTRSRTLTYY